MTTEIIITVCVLLLLAYLFDLTSSRTKVPSVILLLALGWMVKQGATFLGINIPNLSSLLPIFGTIGLILIVLEGALELDYERSKLKMIRKSVLVAILPMIVLAVALSFALQYFGGYSFKDCMVNAIPLCVISSAIAIPTAANLDPDKKEFVIYETSLSDIIGVVFFNFVALNEDINTGAFGHFFLELFSILVISFVATIGLSFFLSKIRHHIKFGPIIIIILLIYGVSKLYHLPGLIFILLFGLFLGNLDEFKRYKWIEKLHPEKLKKEVLLFRDISGEAAFLVRALFFILFGFLMDTAEVLNPDTLGWAGGIVAGIFVTRAIFLKLAKVELFPLLFIAPRGLITILLFYSITPMNQIALVNKSLIVQVILLSALLMMMGVMATKRKNSLEKALESA
jgi:cell volume regulation protein A